MSRVFFISDLHFGHDGLCQYMRGMSSKESDEIIINNWNEVVNKKDIVYVLGDITMENPYYINYLESLNGTIRIIGGNHDTLRCIREIKKLTKEVEVIGCFQYKGYICTHTPMHPQEVSFFRGNIHGHIHNKKLKKGFQEYSPFELGDEYFNVNCEYHNYTPILFDDIEKRFEQNKLNKQTIKINEKITNKV